MKKKLIFISLGLSTLLLCMCTPKADTRTIEERLAASNRIISATQVTTSRNFPQVFSIKFKQYIDHTNPSAGTFEQRLELGFKTMDKPMVFVTEGYFDDGGHHSYSRGENEIAFLLNTNYLTMEHRYFGESLPEEIDYEDNSCWQYLTTSQAAGDAHEVVKEFKKIFKNKWISTGASKSGMTTEAFCYYYPGDVDIYVPYVAPFCNSRYDSRMARFVYEEAGDLQYGEARAAEIRNEVLQFQVKMLKYRYTLAPRYYQTGINKGAEYTSYVTADLLYDAAVFEFAIGFWQYYQTYSRLETLLNKPETTESEITSKMEQIYNYLIGICAPEEFTFKRAFTPYYVQAWQELGNYCLDYSYIRAVLPSDVHLTISEEEEATAAFKIVLSEKVLQLEQKELLYSKINNMLSTTEEQFIIIYGSSDPWYAVRPDDVTGRDNINIYVNDNYPHTTCISNFDNNVKQEIIAKINSLLN